MKKTLTAIACLVTVASFAQKTIKIKHGKINSGEEPAAEYDGKGGLFKPIHYTITLPGDTNTLVKLDEITERVNNPLLKEAYYYEMHFATHPGKTYYLRPAARTIKLFGIRDTIYERKTGTYLVEQLFNDTLPFIIQNKTLNKEKVDELLAKIAFDYTKMQADNKLLEDSIGVIANYEIARDKSKPLVFRRIANTANNTVDETYSIEQAAVQIGKVVKIIDPSSSMLSYEFWKKAPAGTVLLNRAQAFVPVAALPNTYGGFNNQYELVLVTGKEKIKFTSTNYQHAENELTLLLISKGLL